MAKLITRRWKNGNSHNIDDLSSTNLVKKTSIVSIDQLAEDISDGFSTPSSGGSTGGYRSNGGEHALQRGIHLF